MFRRASASPRLTGRGRENVLGSGRRADPDAEAVLVGFAQGSAQIEPLLATSWEANDDATVWTFTLREGVTFHDGTPLDAETLKWNFDTLHNHEESRNYADLQSFGVTGMEIVDDMTVMYTLSEPNAAFPDLLRGDIGWPVSRQAWEAMGQEEFGQAPVGTGPFKFESWTRDDRLIVTRNEDYWFTTEDGDQLPYLDQIEFRPIPDDDSRTASLQSDDIQVLQTLRGPSVKAVQQMVTEGTHGASLFVGNTSSVTVINTLNPPLDDIRVRRALAMSNDQESMAAVRDDDGLVPPANGFFSQDSPWYSEKVADAYPKYDPARSKELVDEYKADPDRLIVVHDDLDLELAAGERDPVADKLLMAMLSIVIMVCLLPRHTHGKQVMFLIFR